MIIYRCEDPRCGKDFAKETDLQEVKIVIGDKTIDYQICAESANALQKVIGDFFQLTPTVPDQQPKGAANEPAAV